MDTKNTDQVIYLKDLLFSVLRNWHRVLIIALITALLLGGFIWASESYAKPNELAQYQEAYADYKLNLDVLTAKANMLKRTLADQQTYLDESIYMNLDPYQLYEASLSLYVDTGYQIAPDQFYQDPDKTTAVLSAYEASFYSKDVARLIAETLNTQTQYATELIACSSPNSSGTFTVSVRCATKEQADAVLAVLTAQVEPFFATISETVVPHTYKVLTQGVACKADSTIALKRTELSDNVTLLQKSLTDNDLLIQGLSAPRYPVKSQSAIIKQALLFVVIGGILGVCLAVACIWAFHILSDKVYSAKTLSNRTGVKILGCLRYTFPKSRFDRWLLKKEGRCTDEPDTRIAFFAAAIRNYCADESKILISGGICADQCTALVQALQTAIPEKQFSCAESLCSSADAQTALVDCDTVILVAQCGKSVYADVAAEADFVITSGKSLTGCIVLDG